MQIKDPILFVEINNKEYNFVAGSFDENQNFEIIEKITSNNEGINENKIINIDQASEKIKKNIEIIEKKLNFVFKETTILLENFDFNCVNISGYKKLNGSQVLKENISFIINSIKPLILYSNQKKSIVHIFNSKNILDNVIIENLPIGLYGNFYSHELTFFLMDTNDLKNVKKIFLENNLKVKKIFLKQFGEGAQLIKNYSNETFIRIKINETKTDLIYFDKSAFKYSESFKFGTDIIYRDIQKICSINNDTIKNFLSSIPFNKNTIDETEILENKFFLNTSFRKIRKKLIKEVAEARIYEIIEIILKKNINIKSFQNNPQIYLAIKDSKIEDNFREKFKSCLLNHKYSDYNIIEDINLNEIISSIAHLSFYGWKKEAIPITQTKKSLVTRVFKSLFG